VTAGRSRASTPLVTVAGALLVTLATPTTWPLALATFLLRGGIVLVALPILVLPTPVGIGVVFGPALTAIAFGSVSPELVLAVGSTVIGLLAWLLAGGWLAAALEAESARIVDRDEEVVALRGPGATAATAPTAADPAAARVAVRILAARLLASLPLALALVIGAVRLVVVTYRELTAPLDVATPILVRVLRGAPEVVIAIVVAWMIAEVVGALAARRIALGGAGVASALRHALVTCARHPVSTLVRFWVPTVALVLVIAPSALAASAAFDATGAVLGRRSDPFAILGGVIVFVGLWIVGLLLASVVCAWRAAVWTVVEATGDGTFGGSGDRRPGHWRIGRSSATLDADRPVGRS
jgi:hypothetical protein